MAVPPLQTVSTRPTTNLAAARVRMSANQAHTAGLGVFELINFNTIDLNSRGFSTSGGNLIVVPNVGQSIWRVSANLIFFGVAGLLTMEFRCLTDDADHKLSWERNIQASASSTHTHAFEGDVLVDNGGTISMSWAETGGEGTVMQGTAFGTYISVDHIRRFTPPVEGGG